MFPLCALRTCKTARLAVLGQSRLNAWLSKWVITFINVYLNIFIYMVFPLFPDTECRAIASYLCKRHKTATPRLLI